MVLRMAISRLGCCADSTLLFGLALAESPFAGHGLALHLRCRMLRPTSCLGLFEPVLQKDASLHMKRANKQVE